MTEENLKNIGQITRSSSAENEEIGRGHNPQPKHVGRLVDDIWREGIVTYIERVRGYGFIQSDEGDVIFFHANDCLNRDFGNFTTGIRVGFFLALSNKGNKVKAIGVEMI